MSHDYLLFAVSYIFPVILIISYISLTLVIYITCRDAANMKKKIAKNGDTKIKEIDNDVKNVIVIKKSGIKKASSCPEFSSNKEPQASPPRKYSRRLSKTESEETADNLLEMMFAPTGSSSPCRLLKRSISDNAVTRRRKYGFSKGSFGLSINSLNMIKETVSQ